MTSARAQDRSWTAKSIVTIKGHTTKVTAAALSPDGRVLASASSGKPGPELRLWDAATGKDIASPIWAEGNVGGFAFSGNSQRLLITGYAAFGNPPAILIWDISQRKILATHHDNRFSGVRAALNHDGSRFATSSSELLGLWEVMSGNPAKYVRQKRDLGGGSFSRDLKHYARGDFQDIELWDVLTCKELKVFGEHRGSVRRTAFSPSGKTLVSASVRSKGYYEWTGQVKLWDLSTGKERTTIAAATHHVLDIAISADEKTLALVDYPEIDGKTELLVVDVPSGKRVLRLHDAAQRFASPIFVNDDRILVVGVSDENSLHVWEVSR
jgi:WD40 repeat protein